MTIRESCRICGSSDLELLIDYGLMPLAGGFSPAAESDQGEKFPLRLFRCRHCTLMQLLEVVPPDAVFRRYSYASSTTRTLREHFARMGPEIVERAGAAGKLAVEFGCNDGVLMGPLIGAGARAIGVDPSDVAVRASLEQGWPLVPAYFTKDVARQISYKYGKAQLVTGNNVFAHADDVHAIVRAVAALLSERGHFVFEVQYQGDLIALAQYDTVYHEHVCYYSLRSLVELLRPYGLRIADVRRIPIHSGSIRVTAVWDEAEYPSAPDVQRLLDGEASWDVRGFAGIVESRQAELRWLVLDLKASGRRICAYGAGGRATILLNRCHLGSDSIAYVVDESPLRCGRYVPGVGVPIVSPAWFREQPPDYAILTAWNYQDEIVAKEKDYLARGGVFIMPLPEVRFRARGPRVEAYAK